MENRILGSFFYVNEKLLKIKSYLETCKPLYIFAPLLTIFAVFTSSAELLNGNLIVLHTIIVCFGVLFSFLLTVVSVYNYKKNNVFKRYKEWKSNQNLSNTINKSKTFNNFPHKDVSVLIADNKDLISKCYSEIRRIGLINDDILQSDFESLIANCFIEYETSFTFKLEVNSGHTSGFIREFFIPILEKIDKNNSVTKKKIASFFYFKNETGYVKFKYSAIKSKNSRVSISTTERQLYDTLKNKM